MESIASRWGGSSAGLGLTLGFVVVPAVLPAVVSTVGAQPVEASDNRSAWPQRMTGRRKPDQNFAIPIHDWIQSYDRLE